MYLKVFDEEHFRCGNRQRNLKPKSINANKETKIIKLIRSPSRLITGVWETESNKNTDMESLSADPMTELWVWVSVEALQTQSSAIKHHGTRAASRSLCVPLFGLELGEACSGSGAWSCLCHSLQERPSRWNACLQRPCWITVALKGPVSGRRDSDKYTVASACERLATASSRRVQELYQSL